MSCNTLKTEFKTSDAVRRACKKYRANNKEKTALYQLNYYHKNKEKINAIRNARLKKKRQIKKAMRIKDQMLKQLIG